MGQTELIKSKNIESKYWIHKFPQALFKRLNKNKCLGGLSKKGIKIKDISPNDKVIIFTTFRGNIQFIAYTMIDEIFSNDENLYDKFESRTKLKLKGIKYFSDPLVAKNIAKNLDFIGNIDKSAEYFRSEYREITKTDFYRIVGENQLTKDFPSYFEDFSFSGDDFLEFTIKSIYGIIKSTKKNHQIEIKSFLTYLKDALNNYGIKKSSDELIEFYAKNAYKFGFKHTPSRDPDKSVFLYNRSGQKRTFGYISLDT
ncbi:MAG: hypothetical protein LBC39_05700 [Methanobrevibacter sp.]|nr:hypothetical protein [Candidatus Methanovirga aequatorialis]